MRIRLTPPRPDSPSFEVDHQIALALAALHAVSIKIRGAGRFGGETTILLARDADSGKALEALGKKGIEGFAEPETQVTNGNGDLGGQHQQRVTSDTRTGTSLPWINLETRKWVLTQQSASALTRKHVDRK